MEWEPSSASVGPVGFGESLKVSLQQRCLCLCWEPALARAWEQLDLVAGCSFLFFRGWPARRHSAPTTRVQMLELASASGARLLELWAFAQQALELECCVSPVACLLTRHRCRRRHAI